MALASWRITRGGVLDIWTALPDWRPGAGRLAGRPASEMLPSAVRAWLESLLGLDLRTVEFQVGGAAEALGVSAFALDPVIGFARGAFDPLTPRGLHLLGHELAHIVQQRTGRVGPAPAAGFRIVRDPGLEAEADRYGSLAATGSHDPRRPGPALLADHGPGGIIQCSSFQDPLAKLLTTDGPGQLITSFLNHRDLAALSETSKELNAIVANALLRAKERFFLLGHGHSKHLVEVLAQNPLNPVKILGSVALLQIGKGAKPLNKLTIKMFAACDLRKKKAYECEEPPGLLVLRGRADGRSTRGPARLVAEECPGQEERQGRREGG